MTEVLGGDDPSCRTAPAIIHETPEWIVFAKPAGWHSVAPGKRSRERGDATHSPHVEGWLRQRFPWAADLPEGGLIHRLDFETSGCLMAARTSQALERLRSAFRSESAVGKSYLAIVTPGLPRSGEFSLYFTTRRTHSTKVTVRDRGEEKSRGCSRWVDRGGLAGARALEVEIIGPGRRHQIRAGFAYLGHPLLGDGLYGGGPWNGGFGLHAWRLTVDGIEVTCPPPIAWGWAPDGATPTAAAR